MTTATEILKTVKELAAASPDTLADCKYFNDDKTPCCVVGHALAKHGITAEAVEGRDPETGDRLNTLSVGCGLLAAVGVVEDSEEAVVELSRIQARQDRRLNWCNAVAPGHAF